jgi:hypothetical protein
MSFKPSLFACVSKIVTLFPENEAIRGTYQFRIPHHAMARLLSLSSIGVGSLFEYLLDLFNGAVDITLF